MQHTVRNVALILIVLGVCAASIFPPAEKLRRGRDLAGGVSLVYTVDLGDDPTPGKTIDAMIEVLKERVDPKGLYEIAFVRQGPNRIEVSMPLPTEHVKALKKHYTDLLDKLRAASISDDELDRIMRLEKSERDARIAEIGASVESRLTLLRKAAEAYDSSQSARDAYEQARKDEAPPEVIDEMLAQAGDAVVAYEKARQAVRQISVSAEELETALRLPDEQRSIRDDKTGKQVTLESPRKIALDRLKADHSDAIGQIEEVIAAYNEFANNRKGLDDPQDLKRLLRGAGVLNFRIAVSLGELPEEARLRQDLAERGPRLARTSDAAWYQIHDIGTWYSSTAELEALQANPASFFAGRGLVGAERDGLYYLLLFDSPGLAITENDGDWAVSTAFQSADQLGRPSIAFRMDALGAKLLGKLTGPNIGKQMAVLLDDRVYTAPTLQGQISSNGQITGSFPLTEITYLVRTLRAGSLQAKLRPEPISEETLGPELGADNLRRGFEASVVALIAVAIFMVFYYFSSGLVAVIALFANAIIILGAMSLNRAAFTLPGVAGVVLTFGMAVDANVLIYERIREELSGGADFKTAVRIGYDKVLSTIVDANVTNLIVCFVLYYTATPEIRGFAVTLGIGIIATLFSALVITRTIFTVLVEHLHVKSMPQLPMIWPALQRLLSPNVNWLRLRMVFIPMSVILLGVGLVLVATQGSEMLGHQFRGGVTVSVQLKDGIKKTRADIKDLILDATQGATPGSALEQLRSAEILAVAPEADGVTSDAFKIKTVATDRDVVSNTIVKALGDLIEEHEALTYVGDGVTDTDLAPIYHVLEPRLGESIGKPEILTDVTRYIGGVAILIDQIDPPQTKESLEARLGQMRQQVDFSKIASRDWELVVLDGSDNAVRSAALVTIDDALTFFDNEDRWKTDVAAPEWALVHDALTTSTTLTGVQSFSPQIASTFRAQAIVAVILSFAGILMYVWFRFGSLRYSVAAIVALMHDVVAVVGLIAVAEILYRVSPGFAHTLLIEPFKIDLGLIAALLTIIGYSLNDTIVILDRIRENRGKLAYTSAEVVNRSINQTFSRTIITSGTTFIAVGIMYVVGGEGIRSFTYALLCGVVVGTYSSVAIAAPLAYSGKTPTSGAHSKERHASDATHAKAALASA